MNPLQDYNCDCYNSVAAIAAATIVDKVATVGCSIAATDATTKVTVATTPLLVAG